MLRFNPLDNAHLTADTAFLRLLDALLRDIPALTLAEWDEQSAEAEQQARIILERE